MPRRCCRSTWPEAVAYFFSWTKQQKQRPTPPYERRRVHPRPPQLSNQNLPALASRALPSWGKVQFRARVYPSGAKGTPGLVGRSAVQHSDHQRGSECYWRRVQPNERVDCRLHRRLSQGRGRGIKAHCNVFFFLWLGRGASGRQKVLGKGKLRN